MIKEIQFVQYKKFKNISLGFEAGINAISGENGTCKSSLLYLISNSFQAMSKQCSWVKDVTSLQVINAINNVVNKKVESLQRGDQKYNDPAFGVKGNLFTVRYYDHYDLGFRRHNSTNKNNTGRYSLKPYYPKGSGQQLPFCPVVYLGLSRLVPYGEFQNDEAIAAVDQKLPEAVQSGIATNFKKFTFYNIAQKSWQKMGDLKKRSDFVSDYDGVDSNTISAGEDNLYIILAALESLKYYFSCIDTKRDIESVLLIDEFDATLHPSFQEKLLDLMREYAADYKIQICFTTHSLTAVENVLNHRDNLIYLVDNVTDVAVMEEPTIQSIKAHLYHVTTNDIYKDKHIPIFTEDAEARLLIQLLFEYFEETRREFRDVRRFFVIPEINLGSDQLYGLFSDEKLIRAHVGAFCILDGDRNPDIESCIITLPGKNAGEPTSNLSPEQLLLNYAARLEKNDSPFWKDKDVLEKNFGKRWYKENIEAKVLAFEEENKPVDGEDGNAKEQRKQKRRVFNKALFNDNKLFFEYLFRHWLHNEYNANTIDRFYNDLKNMFKKCCSLRGINKAEWK